MEMSDRLDPEISELLAAFPLADFDFGDLTASDLPALRESMKEMPRPEPLEQAQHRRYPVATTADRSDLVVDVYRHRDARGTQPCIFWIHGGGFIIGSSGQEAPRCERWCVELGCVVVSVEYRLAPEHPFPAPLDDCYDALRWTFDHSDDLGIDRTKIAIAGTSAGAGLAAGLALMCRDRGELAPCFQMLLYPMLDDRPCTVSSRHAPVWSSRANHLGWSSYLGTEPGGNDVSPYAAPARATDLRGLPATFIAVGTVDLFCGEDIDYARRLIDSDVPTELHVYPGAPHGFDAVAPSAVASLRVTAEIDAAFARALAGPSH